MHLHCGAALPCAIDGCQSMLGRIELPYHRQGCTEVDLHTDTQDVHRAMGRHARAHLLALQQCELHSGNPASSPSSEMPIMWLLL